MPLTPRVYACMWMCVRMCVLVCRCMYVCACTWYSRLPASVCLQVTESSLLTCARLYMCVCLCVYVSLCVCLCVCVNMESFQCVFPGLVDKDTSGRVRVNLASMQNILLKAYLPGTNFGSLGVARAMEIFGVEGQLSPNGVCLACVFDLHA